MTMRAFVLMNAGWACDLLRDPLPFAFALISSRCVFFLSKGNADFYFVVTSRARVGSDRFVTGTRV